MAPTPRSKRLPPRPKLDKTLEQMDPEFLTCRDFGHLWEPFGAVWLAKDRCYEQSIRCRRCTCVRYRMLTVTGHIVSGHYNYPDGYQMPPGTGHLTTEDRDAIRIRSIQRTIEESEKRKRA